jgi:glycine amidinotransferase
MTATMPLEHLPHFKFSNAFPADILTRTQEELDNSSEILRSEGVRVYRPKKVNWLKEQDYTVAMPRDGLMTVCTTIIETPFARSCRRQEINLGYSEIPAELESPRSGLRFVEYR